MSHYRYGRRPVKQASALEAALAIIIMVALTIGIIALMGGVFALAWNWFVPIIGGPSIPYLGGVGAVILLMMIGSTLRFGTKR